MLQKIYRKCLSGPIAQSTFQTTLVLGLRLFVQAGTLLIVARMLGPSQFAAFAGIAALAVLMGTFATFGTHLVLLAQVSRDPAQRDHILPYAVPTTLISGGLLFAAYLLITQTVFANLDLSFLVLFCIGLAETVLLPLFVLPAVEELALEKAARSQLLMVLPLVLRMAVAALVASLQVAQPLPLFALLYVASAVLALLTMRLLKPHAWPAIRRWRLATKVELKHSVGYAALAMTAAGPSELDKMLAVKLMPLGASGLYAAASRVIGAAVLPVVALLLSAMPKLFRHNAQPNAQGQRLSKWIFISVFVYGWLLAGLLYLVAPLIEWLFGEKYIGMAQILQMLCLAVPGMALRHTATSILMTLDLPWLRAGVEVLGMLIFVALAIILTLINFDYAIVLSLAMSEWMIAALALAYLLKIKNEKTTNYHKKLP